MKIPFRIPRNLDFVRWVEIFAVSFVLIMFGIDKIRSRPQHVCEIRGGRFILVNASLDEFLEKIAIAFHARIINPERLHINGPTYTATGPLSNGMVFYLAAIVKLQEGDPKIAIYCSVKKSIIAVCLDAEVEDCAPIEDDEEKIAA